MKYLKTYGQFLKPEGNEVDEMGLGDWKVKAILASYNKGDLDRKKEIAKTITGDEDANLAEITKEIRALDKDELDEFAEDLKIDESASEIPELRPDDIPMVNGIADILKKIKDVGNRKEIAEDQIRQFKQQGIEFDYSQFLKMCDL